MNFELFVLITISHCCYQYQLRPTPPVALERVANNVPDFQCTGCIVWALVLNLFGTTVKLPIAMFEFAICVAGTLRNWMWLHPSNSCKHCKEPCSVTCWVYLGLNHRWIYVWDNSVDEVPRLSCFGIRQYPHCSPYLDPKVSQSLYFPNELFLSCWCFLSCYWIKTFDYFWEYRSCTCRRLWSSSIGSIVLGTIWHSLPLEYLSDWSRRLRRRLETQRPGIWN